ncbi:hypothetical protein NSK11_contig00094-0039 [Nocardia seriolae]|nr:hypothetical protein C6575_23875 [Nocardia seriolae]RLP29606.1 hypothetical protein D6158_22895 [Nocardia seriolae]GAM48849.1 hypothetical protein NS07_v2contig00089-0003 [Nocardia seriolae]GAP30809.1 hypothetical protein NSK11_contig00094-0039 [Nocardia seriolae]
MSPAEVAAMTQRLVFTDDPVEPAIATGADAEPVLIPRSVKLTRELDKACKLRAANLGMSQSAYIRSLIERDIATAGTSEQRPAWVRELLAVIAQHENDEHRKAS